MRKLAFGLLFCSSVVLFAADTAQERLSDATGVFNEIMAVPDKAVPQDLLEKANCIVIVPGMKQAAFGVGAKWGRGYAVCRQNHAGWVHPLPYGWKAAASVSRSAGPTRISSCWS